MCLLRTNIAQHWYSIQHFMQHWQQTLFSVYDICCIRSEILICNIDMYNPNKQNIIVWKINRSESLLSQVEDDIVCYLKETMFVQLGSLINCSFLPLQKLRYSLWVWDIFFAIQLDCHSCKTYEDILPTITNRVGSLLCFNDAY